MLYYNIYNISSLFAGIVVLTMSAIDYDDPLEDGNAQIVYNIEKNVLDEQTGTPIFTIEPTSGLITTNICCLDREKTPDYSLQVVAMDGGGLKGIQVHKLYSLYIFKILNLLNSLIINRYNNSSL